MSLTFAQTQFVLAFVSQIAPDRADAFQARLKQWQKMGFPEGVNVGRGGRAAYGATQVYQLLFMLKLLHVGLTPERAQKVVLTGWQAIKDAVVETAICRANGEEHLHYCLVQLDALSELKVDRSDHMHVFIDTFTSEEITEAFLSDEEFSDWLRESGEDPTETVIGRHRYISFLTKNRLATSICIEVDSLLALLWASLEPLGLGPEIFADELGEWERERRARGRALQDASEHYDGLITHESVVSRAHGFDVVDAARKALGPRDHRDVQESSS